MTENLSSIEQFLLIVAVFVISIILFIVLVRLVLFFIIEKLYRRSKDLARRAKEKIIPQKKKFDKVDDELLRKLEIPRAHSAVKAEMQAKANQGQGTGYELMPAQEQQHEVDQVEIVDVVKPIGFWTSMILGQKLTYLIQSANTINKRGNKGFWVSMIEAKEREQGKQHARGR